MFWAVQCKPSVMESAKAIFFMVFGGVSLGGEFSAEEQNHSRSRFLRALASEKCPVNFQYRRNEGLHSVVFDDVLGVPAFFFFGPLRPHAFAHLLGGDSISFGHAFYPHVFGSGYEN